MSYENIFITTSVFIGAFIMRPIKASFAFNAKYGFSILDPDILCDNRVSYSGCRAQEQQLLYDKHVMGSLLQAYKGNFQKESIDTYYRVPVIYISGSKAKIELRMNLFAKNVIMVKFTGVSSVIELSEPKRSAPNEEFRNVMQSNSKKSRYLPVCEYIHDSADFTYVQIAEKKR